MRTFSSLGGDLSALSQTVWGGERARFNIKAESRYTKSFGLIELGFEIFVSSPSGMCALVPVDNNHTTKEVHPVNTVHRTGFNVEMNFTTEFS